MLDEQFLEEMSAREVLIIRVHPALLPEDDSDTVMTSRGRIPVLRRPEALQEAYKNDPYRMQVSGVTIQQVLAGRSRGVGPVVLKEQVRRHPDEPYEEWEERMQKAQQNVLPVAINYVLHVMNSGIDASKGRYPW